MRWCSTAQSKAAKVKKRLFARGTAGRGLICIFIFPLLFAAIWSIGDSLQFYNLLMGILTMFLLLPDNFGKGNRSAVLNGPYWVLRRIQWVLGLGAILWIAGAWEGSALRLESWDGWPFIPAMMFIILAWSLMFGWWRFDTRPVIRRWLIRRTLIWLSVPVCAGLVLGGLRGDGIVPVLGCVFILTGAWTNLLLPFSLPRQGTTQAGRKVLILAEVVSMAVFAGVVVMLIGPETRYGYSILTMVAVVLLIGAWCLASGSRDSSA
ncbi:hypothetical protein ACU6TU_13690 [Halomonas sp. LS-001]